MIGFFEHQYLSFKKTHLKNLISLAKVDGHLHEDEKNLLRKVGEKYGLRQKQIQQLIDSEEKFDLNIPESHDQKMNQLYDLVLMVYADGVVDKNEVHFCKQIVNQYGFKEEIVDWMIRLFDQGKPPHPSEWEELKQTAKEEFIAWLFQHQKDDKQQHIR